VKVLGRSAVSRSEAGLEFDSLHDSREFGSVPGFREAAAEYLQSLSGLSHRLLTSIGRALRRDDNFFVDHHTGNPQIQWQLNWEEGGLRPAPEGLLRIDLSDEAGVLLCRVGGGLARLSGGRYRAVPIRTVARGDRVPTVAMPFSFDSATGSTQRVGGGRRSRAIVGGEVVAAVIAGRLANAPWAVG
jgi:isopenicillin N synthase-like dioxygenase